MKKFVLILTLTFFSFNVAHINASDCIDLSKTLKYGTRDSLTFREVTILQTFLFENNYLHVNPTGYFGSLTLKATKRFQSENNLVVDGIVGPLTRAEIKKVSCEVNTSISTPLLEPEIPAPITPVIETLVVPTTPTLPVVEDVILTAPNNSSLKVRTDGTISINSNSILVRGSVTGGARSGTERWFELTKNPDVYKVSETIVSLKIPQKTDGNFEQIFNDLNSETTYYYRVCAENISLGQKSCGGTISVKTN